MSESIDRRVVEMRFDNKDFEQKANVTMTVLEKLKEKLSFKGAGEKFESASGLSSAIDGVKSRFSAMEVVGMTALVNLTNSAVNLGKNLARSLTVDQVRAGFAEYELKMGSIQTIMASTGKDIDTVNGYLNKLNEYSDKTIYSFSDMTSSIGKFTNAGVDLDTAVKAIQGISNEAAVSGANAQEASRAMYNFAQALSAGYVKLIDWKSIENANMATKEFKQQLIDTAVEMGNLEKNADGTYKVLTQGANGSYKETITATKNFNDSLSAAWMTTDVLTTTLGRYADETTDIGKKAFAAAQDVKTFSQLIDTVKESIGSGWAQTFEIIFGNLEEAKKLWTSVNNVISDFVGKTSDARNNLLQGWKDFTFGGTKSVDIVKKFGFVVSGLSEDTKAASAAQRIFYQATHNGYVKLKDWKSIENAGLATKDFKQRLLDAAVEMGNLEKNADGTYKVLTDGAKKLDKDLRNSVSATNGFNESLTGAWMTADVFAKAMGSSSDGLIMFGDTARDVLLKSLGNIFKGFGSLASSIHEAFRSAFAPLTSDQLVNMTLGFARFSDTFLNTMKVLGKELQTPFEDIFKAGKDVIDLFKDALSGLFNVLNGDGGEAAWFSLVTTFAKFIAMLARGVSAVISFARASGIFKVINAALLGVNNILFAVSEEVYSLIDSASELTGVFSSLAGPAQKISEAIGTLFTNISEKKFKVIEYLASGLGKLFSLVGKGLSHLNLAKIGGILAGGGILVVGMKIAKLIDTVKEKFEGLFGGDGGGEGFIDKIKGKLNELSDALNSFQATLKIGQLVAIAISLGVLAASCAVLADIPAKKLATAVAAIGGLFVELGVASHLIKGAKTKGIVALSVAVLLLAKAVKNMSEIEDMGKGLLGIGAILGELTAFCLIFDRMKIKPRGLKKTGEGLILMAIAINLLAKPVKELGAIDSNQLVQGLLAIAAMLGGFTLTALALSRVKTRGLTKAGMAMVVMAVAMKLLVGPLTDLGSMDLPTLAKGLGAMAVALAELAGFTAVMGLIAKSSGSIMASSAALLIMAVGIKIMAGAIAQMGVDANAGQGLSVLFGSLLILAMAMAAMQSSVAGAAAMIIAAGALAIMAPAIALLSSLNFIGVVTGLAALAGTFIIFGVATAVLAPIIPLMIGLAAAMALLGVGVLGLGAGMMLLVGAFSMAAAPIITGAQMIAQAFPIIAKGVGEGIVVIIKTIGNSAKAIEETLGKIVDAILGVLTDILPDVIAFGLKFILALLKGINSNIGKIAEVAVSIIANFINGISKGLPDLVDAGFNLIISLLNSMADAISEKGDILANAMANVLLAALGAIVGLIPGFGEKGKAMIEEYRKGLEDKTEKGKLDKTSKDLATDSEKNMKIKDQSSNGKNAVRGIVSGMDEMIPTLRAKSNEVSDIVDETMRKRNLIHSPSRRLAKTGAYLMQGLIKGVDSLTDKYQKQADNISTMLLSSATNSVNGVNDIFSRGFSNNFGLNNSLNHAVDVSLSMAGIKDRDYELNKKLSKLTNTLDGMTESMNSRSLNNYINIDGASDPEAFADNLLRSFRLNARTV